MLNRNNPFISRARKQTSFANFVHFGGDCQRAVKTSQGWADENRPL